MNRAVRKIMNRRCALKATNDSMYGGGLAVNTLAPYTSANGAPIESRVYTDECYNVLRPGEIRAEVNPSLAQVTMAGGSIANPISMTRHRKTHRKGRKQRGGSKGGFGVDPSINIGGEGPIAAPANVAVPCDTRAGVVPASIQMNPDPRAYSVGYSATPNQTAPTGQAGGAYMDTRITNFAYAATQAGGAYGSGFEGPDCYKATGSSMPVYPAQSVGFNFSPSTAAGASYSDGVTPFNEVNQVVARTGGARKSRKGRKSCRKANRKARRKASRKAHRKSRKNTRK